MSFDPTKSRILRQFRSLIQSRSVLLSSASVILRLTYYIVVEERKGKKLLTRIEACRHVLQG